MGNELKEVEIYTSYHANYRKLRSLDIGLVNIARKVPNGFEGHSISELFPPAEMIHAGLSPEEFTKRYKKEVLSKINIISLLEKLLYLTNNGQDKIALLCYEGPDKFCHRQLVADFINKQEFRSFLPVVEFSQDVYNQRRAGVNLTV